MATSTEIKQRANALADKTDVNSITPKEVGGIMYDLASHGENVLRNGGTLGIRKVYESVASMEADSTNPKDFWGDPIKKGNLVVIYDGTTTGVDNNKIYAFMNPGWELATKLDAGYATKAGLDAAIENVLNSLRNSEDALNESIDSLEETVTGNKKEVDAKLSELGSKVWYVDIKEKSHNINDAIVYLSINAEYKKNWTLQSFDTESYPKGLILWENKEDNSYKRHELTAENAIIQGEIYEWKTSLIHLIVDFSKTDITFGKSEKTDFYVNPSAFRLMPYSSVFSIPGFATYRNGRLVFNQNFIATPYIEVTALSNNDIISCYFNNSVGIQLFDEKYNFIGEYPNSKTEAGDLLLNKDLLPTEAKYLRCCKFATSDDARIGNMVFVSFEDTPNLGYVVPSGNAYNTIAKGFRLIQINDTLENYEKVCIGRIPSLEEVVNEEGYFNIRFWKDTNLSKNYTIQVSVGAFADNVFEFNDGYVHMVVDYGILGNLNAITMNTYEASSNLRIAEKCFLNNIMPYVITQTSGMLSIAKGFRNFRLKRNYADITIQRVPATADALVENSTENFVFYVWDGNNVSEKIYKHINEADVVDGVISFKGTDFNFEVDYNVIGEISRKASSSRQDLTLTKRCFVYTSDISAYERPDLVGKEYANISSSTFSSYGWHKRCIENLGMIYSNYGIGGSSHRCYASTKFNLNFQDAGQPTSDKVVLNMVAKICVDSVVNGYNPDVIASCCVLNDCYKSIIPEGSDVSIKIGTAEDALNIVMPDFDLSSEESIVTSFTNFFESEDDVIKYYRDNSTICNRIALELLSRAFPKASIIVCSCQQVTSDSFNQEAIKFFNEQQKKLCQYYAIPYIDINGECGINSVTAATFLKDDKLHPNSDGELVYTNYYSRQLISRLHLKYPSK